MKTFLLRNEDVVRKWYHVDASDKVLGRLAVKIARTLMNKEDPRWTPSTDSGHFVVVTNAAKVQVTGTKASKKVYRRHTGYVGGLVEEKYDDILQSNPERIIEQAVKRMLPKTRQGRAMFKRLKVFPGAEHDHAAQQPEPFPLEV
ncbi:MAG: 50S ribosomal protein L13 [Planctomycetota bacterium]